MKRHKISHPGPAVEAPEKVVISAVMTRAAAEKKSQEVAAQENANSDVVPPVAVVPATKAVIAKSSCDEADKVEVVAEVVHRNEENSDSSEVIELESLGSPGLAAESVKDCLRREIEADDTLNNCKDLASRKQNGYVSEDGLLFQEMLDEIGVCIRRLVLPVCRRSKVLTIAHEKNGHVGVRSMRSLINKRFTWPGMGRDITHHVRSCSECLKHNRAGNKQVKMVERPVITVPFESVAFDLVGPLPKARGGVKYVLTYICMASRWPEAVALRNVTAETVASGMCNITWRTGIPLRILTDRGTVFLSKVVDRLCDILGIDIVHTSSYRPQSNGVLERLHGTLKPMLSKANENGVDWADFLPMTMFAIRQVPNKSTGFSPHELVFGRNMVGPLDLVYTGWVDDVFREMDISDWVVTMQDRLMLLHDVATTNELSAIEKRAEVFNKHKSDRSLNEGDLVLLRVPGIHVALSAAWEGPFVVVQKISRVTYKVRRKDSDHERVVHINNTKIYREREKHMAGVSVVAEEDAEMEKWVNKKILGDEFCEGYSEMDISALLDSHGECFSLTPGLCSVGECKIVLEDGHKVVNIPPRNIPVHIRSQVEAEIHKLLNAGIIVPSDEEWSSPIVPVRKKDGSIRLCVDFRELNAITPLRRFWLPSLREILDQVGPCAVLSKLDLTAGFHQIRMEEASSKYTSFSCPLGKFRFVQMTLRTKECPSYFPECG